jgi:CheY-like chemotaxis protein
MTLLMIVEDDDDIRETVSDLLRDQGYDVAGATDGADGLKQLLQGGLRPSLIFLDRTMPVMDGMEFRRQQLAAGDDIAGIPVVLMTAANAIESIVADIRPNYVLRKPMSFDDLLQTLDRALAPAA